MTAVVSAAVISSCMSGGKPDTTCPGGSTGACDTDDSDVASVDTDVTGMDTSTCSQDSDDPAVFPYACGCSDDTTAMDTDGVVPGQAFDGCSMPSWIPAAPLRTAVQTGYCRSGGARYRVVISAPPFEEGSWWFLDATGHLVARWFHGDTGCSWQGLNLRDCELVRGVWPMRCPVVEDTASWPVAWDNDTGDFDGPFGFR